MKKISLQILLCCLLTLLTVICGISVFQYVRPMKDQVYDLSAAVEDGQEHAVDKGWTVFTLENGARTELIPDGIGGFSGLSHAGQTFYFSRTMTETLDTPMLRLGVVNRSVAVYLNDTLIYTDCPEQTGGIGTLTLPMQDYDRADPLLIPLPAGYQGQLLTIAQSTDPAGTEKQVYDDTVYPCDVTLYCGYAYESSLISESWQAAIPSTLLFGIDVILLLLFIIGLFLHRNASHAVNWGLLCIFAAALLTSLGFSVSADYTSYYNGSGIDVFRICRLFGFLALLVFLNVRAGKHRAVSWFITGLYAVSCTVSAFLLFCSPVLSSNAQVFLLLTLTPLTGFTALLAAFVMGLFFWRRKSLFYRLFSILMTSGIALYLIVLLLSLFFAPEWGNTIVTQILRSPDNSFTYLLWRLMILTVAAAIVSELVTLIQQEMARRTEAAMLSERIKLAQNSYETLRTHNEEVMLLRHDMTNHLKTLRSMNDVQAISSYLDALLGQNEKIRPIIWSGNEMFDILLNGKLNAAMERGIKVEILCAEAPEVIPLSDAELSSVVLNLIDNAIKAACLSNAVPPLLQIKAHCKDNFFVFSCENSASPRVRKEPSRYGHGLGLKIIQQIADRRNCLFTTEWLDHSFRAIFAVPLRSLRSSVRK